jgi:Carbohydrate family 9 binding domain-like
MSAHLPLSIFCLLLTLIPAAAEPLRVKFAKSDMAPSADPKHNFWADAEPVVGTRSNMGVENTGHRMEVRAKWTAGNLYVLFTCPYEELYLNANPALEKETNKLWEHDVAEVFIGADFDAIHHYREYQVSPQGEWVDLDIDTKTPLPDAAGWNSGMIVRARIDKAAKTWHGEMRIPLKSITAKPVAAGTKMRGNFYRFQGPPSKKVAISWIPTGRPSNHTPEKFGEIEFVK